ncbi:facilitated trehalose transporter Tret1-like [Agrilus planipennis]|uniref:Facilitated trehalose transporter Tret1-like n=1 Tax=Agrilus planipennis TaxID=224129 RepID=A0A1W4WNI1_AGRPL|nr:facilitated trehalose transporter Tret1-like [Agrilus planipennis]
MSSEVDVRSRDKLADMVNPGLFLNRITLGRDVNQQWPQVLAAVTISLYAFFIGVSSCWMSPSIPKLIQSDSYIPMTFEETANFGILKSLSMIIFSFVGAFVGDVIGRKKTSYVVSMSQLISWLFIVFGKNTAMLYTSRIISGISDSFMLFSLPYYVAETTEKHIRGRLGILLTVCFSLGTLTINIIGYYLTIPSTAMIMAIACLVHFLIFALMPESPYWLIQRNRPDEARQQLQLLRWRDDVDKEFAEISEAVQKQCVEKGSYKDLFTVKYNRKALIITLVVRIAQQLSGFSAMNGFMQFIFDESGGNIPRHVSASICAVVSGIASLNVAFIIDRYGRRPLMLLSGTGCSILLFSIALIFHLKLSYHIFIIDWLPLMFMLLYITAQSVGFAMIPNITLGELFSVHMKCKAGLVVTVTHGAVRMSTTKIFQVMVDNFGLYSPFLFFAICTTIMTVVVYYTFIETKNKTLDEIQTMLKGKR